MHPLAERVLSHIRRQQLLRAGDRVGVAVSGGIDSVALLRLLLELRGELGIVLSVVHFNHKLRGAESDGDEEFVAVLARAHDLEFFCDCDDVAVCAAEEHKSIETAARELRYGFFRYLLGEGRESGTPLKPASSRGPQRDPGGTLFHGTAESVALPTPTNDDRYGLRQSPLLARRAGEECSTTAPNLDKIATGHTLDDQAETVLMRMIRGAGMRGLAGIHPRIPVEDDEGEICGEIVRPVLTARRREFEQYLKDIGQRWREDASNSDAAFTRNRVRKLVVPLLEKEFNPAVAGNLAEMAEIAREEEDYWENEITGWTGTAVCWSEPDWARASRPSLVQLEPGSFSEQETPARDDTQARAESELRARVESAPWLVMNASVDRLWFLSEPVAVQRRVVKAIGEQAGIPLEFKHVEEILHFAADDASAKQLSLPLGWRVRRDPGALVFATPDLREPEAAEDYEYELAVPGLTKVAEAGSTIEVRRIPAGDEAGYNPDHLLDAEFLRGPLRVRNWRPGDRFWPVHTKSPKKIKELLQERRVAQPERRLWPVVMMGEEIVWLRGFPAPAKFRAKPGRAALFVAETPLPWEPGK